MRLVLLSEKADKQIIDLPSKIQDQIYNALELLENEAENLDIIKLKGKDNFYRVRKGDYRIIFKYQIETKVIYIVKVEHRKEVYKNI